MVKWITREHILRATVNKLAAMLNCLMLSMNVPFNNEIPELNSADDTDPTLHELHQTATVNAWEKLRSRILFVATENSAMLSDQVCMVCNTSAKFKCERCGPNIYYCFQCFCKQHETANFFHVAEEWEVGH